MQQAKEKVAYYAQSIEPVTPEDRDEHMNGLKPEINSLLHSYLPPTLTLAQVELLALTINDMIWFPMEYLPKP